MTDATPSAPERPLIEGYGAGRFRVAGAIHEGSILVFPDRCCAWPVRRFAEVDAAALADVLAAVPAVEILLLGCGAALHQPDPVLRQSCREGGLALEAMDTGAACRTYNILAGEERRVAAALIAVD